MLVRDKTVFYFLYILLLKIILIQLTGALLQEGVKPFSY